MNRAGKARSQTSTKSSKEKETMPSSASTSSGPYYLHNNNSSSSNNNNNNIQSQKGGGISQNGGNQSAKSEISDEASSAEADGPITLDVLLPTGKHMDIKVDYNTPMIDLLVHVAGKCRQNPTGLILQIFDQETGKPLPYKPNQAVGVLGVREARLLPKEDPNKSKTKGQDKPFEMTHRFIINLPRGQKTVVRVSPLIQLGQLMNSVCEDKSLDIRRHVLQIPGQPGVKVDLAMTIQELGLHELNLVAVGLQDPRSHMVSMPDLSQPPPSSSMPPSFATEHKKKRGFLSFLSKNKDKKLRTQNFETSSTTSYLPRGPPPPQAPRQASTPPAQRRKYSDSDASFQHQRVPHPDSRPKTVYIASDAGAAGSPSVDTNKLQKDQNHKSAVDITAGTGKKKRRAPAPPGPPSSFQNPPANSTAPSMVAPAEKNAHNTHNGEHSMAPETTHSQEVVKQSKTDNHTEQQPALTRAEILSRLHSRNSSDSSGYHELTLSGAESPEAPGRIDYENQQQHTAAVVARLKTSIDTTSIESGAETGSAVNGDSGVHDLSPTRVSPIEEITEKPEQKQIVKETLETVRKEVVSASPATKSGAAPKKKRKAPAPPPPPSSQPQSLSPSSESERPDSRTEKLEIISDSKTDSSKLTVAEVETHIGVQTKLELSKDTVGEVSDEPTPQESSTPRQDDGGDAEATAQLHSDEHEAEDLDENKAFDINDILEGVIFDDEPKSMQLNVVGSRDDAMAMEETASIASESVEQIETARHERPCAFIPPPPPDEPPPPEVEPVKDVSAFTRGSEPVLVDKGTGVNEDNHSLAPLSAKNSPGNGRRARRDSFCSLDSVDTIEGLSMDFEQAIQMGEETLYVPVEDVTVPSGYKSEMALFVERMSKMAVETTSGSSSGQLDDSVSSLSLAASDASDTGSVIRHVREDSKESGSDRPTSGQSPRDAESEGSLPMSEEISVPVETVPPPPEFDDEEKVKGDVEDDDEEYVTETVEQLIIPLTPRGYDFSAAQRVGEESTTNVDRHEAKPEEKEEEVEQRERSGSTGVFRAEPVSIAPAKSFQRPPTPPMSGKFALPTVAPVAKHPSKLRTESEDKEEFVLTTEDLSSVSFLPPKSKTVTTMPISSKSKASVTSSHVSTASMTFKSQDQRRKTTPIRNRNSVELAPENTTEAPQPEEAKPTSILKFLPTMRTGTRNETSAQNFSDDSRSEESNDDGMDPLVGKLTPRLLVNSSSSQKTTSSQRKSSPENVKHETKTIASVSIEPVRSTRSDSSSSNGNVETAPSGDKDLPDQQEASSSTQEAVADYNGNVDQQDALAVQYSALQSQFALWQDQLSRNQTLLAEQASLSPAASLSKASAEQLQQLANQVQAQQEMMMQLQKTMQALQKQQQQQQEQQQQQKPEESKRVELPSVPPPAPPAPPEPPAPPPALPLTAPPTKATDKPAAGVLRVRTLDSPRAPRPSSGRQSRFEPVLDPREELMLAIRGFKGREGLRSVAVKDTKWIHSNR